MTFNVYVVQQLSSHMKWLFSSCHQHQDEREWRDRTAFARLNSNSVFLLLQQGLEAEPPRGKHLLYANRSGANLTLGRKDQALQDANSAAESAPADFSTAYIRQVHPFLFALLTSA